MDNYRAILAIVLAFFILLGYQYLYVGTEQEQPVVEETVEVQQPKVPVQEAQPQPVPAAIVSADQPVKFEEPASLPSQAGKDIVVETDAFTAVITETGGGVKSFKLNRFNETTDADSERKELINTESFTELPLYFSWGVDPSRAQIPLFASDKETLKVEAGESQTLTMTAKLSSGLQVTRRLVFDPDSYLIKMSVDIYNFSETALQGSPYMSLFLFRSGCFD
jgi:YidC/Oxa1 family membrane protein insertase